MSYFLLHRFDQGAPGKACHLAFSTELEAISHARGLLALGVKGVLEVRNDRDEVILGDSDIRNMRLASRSGSANPDRR